MSIADNIGDAIVTFVIDVVRAPFLAIRDARKQQRDHDRGEQIQLAAATAKTGLPRHSAAFASDLLNRLRPRPSDLDYRLFTAAQDLYDMEFTPTPEPPNTTAIEHARYLDQLARYTAKVANPETLRVFTETVQETFEHFLGALPEAAFSEGQATFSVPFADMSDIGRTIEEMAPLFSSIKARDLALFNQLREQLDYNRHYVSGVEFTPHAALPFMTNYKPAKLKRPSEDTDPNIAWRYLQNTPLVDLFNVSIPFDITPHRFDHHHIVGGSGHGKTQALQYLIANDLERVAKGECSIVVIDSQNQLIRILPGSTYLHGASRSTASWC